MTKRTKENFKLIILVIILGISVVFAIKTLWVGINLSMYSNDVIETSKYADEYHEIRKEADAVYESVNAERAKFYNSNDYYVRWISNMDNRVRVPFGMFVIFFPFIFVVTVRKYNENKRRKRKARRQNSESPRNGNLGKIF